MCIEGVNGCPLTQHRADEDAITHLERRCGAMSKNGMQTAGVARRPGPRNGCLPVPESSAISALADVYPRHSRMLGGRAPGAFTSLVWCKEKAAAFSSGHFFKVFKLPA